MRKAPTRRAAEITRGGLANSMVAGSGRHNAEDYEAGREVYEESIKQRM
jgi:hypothetical protein